MKKIKIMDIIRITYTIIDMFLMVKMFMYVGLDNEKTMIYGSILFITSLISFVNEIRIDEEENNQERR